MTNNELLILFPKHPKIDIHKIEELLDKVFVECKQYKDIYEYFESYINTCFPGSDYNKYKYGSYEREEYSSYLYNFEKNGFYEWIKDVEAEYLIRNKSKRTFEEACNIAADKWCDLLFQWHLQDNGAINEDHPGGFFSCVLATLMKNDSAKKIDEKTIKKAHDNFVKYYLDNNYDAMYGMRVDYDPSRSLYDLLKDSGIPEKHIRSLCPWKTSIYIDEKDNSVVYCTYGKREYL